MIVRRLLPTLLAGALLLGACRKAEITSYRIPKETDPEMPMAKAAPKADMASTPVATHEGPSLTWTLPAGWQEKAPTPSRKATLALPGGNGPGEEVSITAFGSDVGGELANLNRWRGQVGLPPVGEAELAGAVTRTEHDGLKIGMVDLAGNGKRLLGAWVPYGGGTWFFKLGPAPEALAAKEKDAFLALLASVKPTASTTR